MRNNRKKNKMALLLLACLSSMLLTACGQSAAEQKASDYVDCVAGLLPDENEGSELVVYPTDTWVASTVQAFPDVTPDNDAAISQDGRYIAYTTWDDGYVRRYLKVMDTKTGETTDFYRDSPIKTEIIDLSWMPDGNTLLFIVNDASQLCYKEIRTLNVQTQEEQTLVKGELWQAKTVQEEGDEDPGAYYLPGAQRSINIVKRDAEGWAYYLTQEDIDRIYQKYGGTGSFAQADSVNFFYVDFSRPRASDDGKTVVYSAKLTRNDAPGEGTPLWMSSAIWTYNMETGENKILYAQPDEGAIGRVDWVDDTTLAYVAYYDFNGGRDSICAYDMKTGTAKEIFPYSEEHYNNVNLLPVGNQKLIFTSVAKQDFYSDSQTMEYNFNTGECTPLDISYQQETVLLSSFSHIKLDVN